MTGGKLAVLLGGLAAVGLGGYFFVIGLDDADKLAGAIGVFVSLAGLGVAVYAVILARRQPSGQSVTDSVVGGEVLQVKGVQGNLRIGSPQPGPVGRRVPGVVPPPASGGQSVTGTRTSGPVRQVDGVGGDADIDT